MSDDRTFERNARSWLELGPTDAPDHVIASALFSIEATPQERDLRLPWDRLRLPAPARLVAAAVMALLVIGATLLSVGGPRPQNQTPSPSPVSGLNFPELRGWIVFGTFDAPDASATDPGGPEIWLVKADGSGLHELAPGKPAGGKASSWGTSFDISPDGKRIAFEGPGPHVWEVPIDGGDPRLLSTDCSLCADRDPAYSPDGTSVAFARRDWTPGAVSSGSVIAVLDLATGIVSPIESTRALPVADVSQWASQPTWSADGSEIAYELFTGNSLQASPGLSDQTRIEVVHVDGTGLHELPVPAPRWNAGSPDWSPDGSVILFWAAAGTGAAPDESIPGDIYTVRSDGTGLTALCREPACFEGASLPSWTPDGRHVMFWSGGSWALMDPDGANAAFIDRPALTFSRRPPFGAFALLQPTP